MSDHAKKALECALRGDRKKDGCGDVADTMVGLLGGRHWLVLLDNYVFALAPLDLVRSSDSSSIALCASDER